MADIFEKFLEPHDQFFENFKKKNMDEIRETYADDVMMIAPDGNLKKGPDSVITYLQGLHDEGVTAGKNICVDYKIHGLLGIYHGRYHLYGESGEIVERGKSLIVSARDKDSDEWKITCGLWRKDQ